MTSILRQIVAGPRARHPEAGLDLCYVTDNIVATSGPSQTYPQRAYRNPLDRLVDFLDSKHGEDWAIWEFRAEGTGYPDHLVYGRVRHYPWPDHHPPPFRLMPMILASMRNWLHGGDLEAAADMVHARRDSKSVATDARPKKDRVVVVHCKAGKGRSGTVSCSYLIAEEGWKAEEALARFTERRMRPKFGAGVTIPSQLRWISYVDRWTRFGKIYYDRAIEIVEIHAWGLRDGVKVEIEGFVEDGKKIEVFHTFNRDERTIVEGDAPEAGGLSDMVWGMTGYSPSPKSEAQAEEQLEEEEHGPPGRAETAPATHQQASSMKRNGTNLIQKVSPPGSHPVNNKSRSKTVGDSAASSSSSSESNTGVSKGPEPGGKAVILKTKQPIRVPSSDVNLSVELRNKAHKNIGLTMVSAVAHVWFNAFFEGGGPEQQGQPDDTGVFTIDWDAMDGIKGSSRKGARALDRVAIVWRVCKDGPAGTAERVDEPAEGQPVPQMSAADWHGANKITLDSDKVLGLRTQSPASADVSKASSLRSAIISGADNGTPRQQDEGGGRDAADEDGRSMEGVRASGPGGEELEDQSRGE